VAATGPVLAGYLRDATGSWDAALVLLAGVALTQALVAAAPAPRRSGLRRAGGRPR
jgi:cyanate permease